MKTLFPLFVLLVILSGCTANNLPTPTEIDATNTVAITETSLPPTASPTPLPTSTPINPYLAEQCLPVLDTPPADLDTQGVLVMQNENAKPPSREVFILDLETNTSLLVNQPLEGIYFGDVSPDGRWIVYNRFFWNSTGEGTSNKDLVISSVKVENGSTYKLIPKKIVQEDPKWFMAQWLDNSNLIIGLSNPNSKSKTETVLIWDPFAGTKQVIPPDFPVLYEPFSVTFPSWGYGLVVYDPTLTRALYFRAESDLSDFQYALWNIEKREVIAMFPMHDEAIDPRWSLDGKKVAIVGAAKRDEIFIIKEDGQQDRLTHMENGGYKYWDANNLYWSPDGSHIAFSLWTKLSDDDKKAEDDIAGLAIADVATGKVTNYCVRIGRYNSDNKITWSPDGRQLIVRDVSVENYSRLILVDIERGIAVQVAENMELFGWMVPQE